MSENLQNATNTMEDTPTKKVSLLQRGLQHMRDPDILGTCRGLLNSAVEKGAKFDALVLNVPWKTIDTDYLQNLPVPDLLRSDEPGALLVWVDSSFVASAVKLIDHWGFRFHSVMHILSFVNPTSYLVSVNPVDTPDDASTKTDETTPDNVGPAENMQEDDAQQSTTSALQFKNVQTRKVFVPTGWSVDGLIPSRSRQLWLAVREVDGKVTDLGRIFKDQHFIRKRLQHVSSFRYPDLSDEDVEGVEGRTRISLRAGVEQPITGISSKKRNFEHCHLYPQYDVFLPGLLNETLESLTRPSVSVMYMFSDGLSRVGTTWGPNVPGYLSAPLRTDGGLPVYSSMLKYFSTTKAATLNKYTNLINIYANQLAKTLALQETQPDAPPALTPIISGRFQDFITDVLRRAEQGGGFVSGRLVDIVPLAANNLRNYAELSAPVQGQLLLLVGHIIRHVLSRNAESINKRRRVIKRKRDIENEDEGSNKENTDPKTGRSNRKFGIAAPVSISPALANFIGISADEKVARTTVVKFMNKYISDRQLQNPSKRSQIILDDALTTLLQPPPGFGPVTYFNLCKLLGHHFESSKENVTEDTASVGVSFKEIVTGDAASADVAAAAIAPSGVEVA